jgi:uncharacterized protein YfdQ (DUF2303 family)
METKADDTVPGTTTTQQSETDALVRAALRFAEVDTFGLITNPAATPQVMVVPAGRTVLSLKKFVDEYRTAPERKAGTSDLTTIDSFVAQVNRSKDEHTVIFADVADRKSPKLIAVFDYNEAGPKGAARFGKHRAVYRYPVSDQWKAWTQAPLEGMTQVDFAEFLETRIMDVLDPASTGKTLTGFCAQLGITLASPQRLMELSRGLALHAEHQLLQNVNIGSGEMQLAFSENHKDASGAPIKIPGGFAIAIPVFLNGPPYQLPVRLRYRAKDGQVRWTLQPQRVDEVWDDAVNESVAAVTTKTDLVTLFGTPESSSDR